MGSIAVVLIIILVLVLGIALLYGYRAVAPPG
jgi:hypothetical protein